jgi:hypothetical protein
MILFIDEDRAYLSWVTHHRNGFVLECAPKPSNRHLMLAAEQARTVGSV